jgi:DNA transposition AAA+ family ATPase
VQTEFIVETRAALVAHIERTGETQTAIAKAIAISGAALSQWIRDEYMGDSFGVANKVRSYLDLTAARAVAPKVVGFVETSVSREVLTVCSFAHVNREIGLVYGEAGMGKTMALREYRSQHPDAIYVRCDPSCATPQAVLELLLAELGRKYRTNDLLHRHIKSLVEALSGTGRLVILDEAQFLGVKALEVMRSIHDSAEIGLVLAGNLEVYARLHGEGTAQFAQLFSRIGIRRHVKLSVPEEDVFSIAGDVGAECLKVLHARANERGGLRRMVKVLRLGRELAGTDGGVLARKHLDVAERMLVGGSRK